ncbi:MAG: hypothetical protein O3A01_01705 [bacterium]|nr:hypothetical protein [bacterium]
MRPITTLVSSVAGVGVLYDISRLVQDERALRASHSKLNAAYNGVKDDVLVVGLSGQSGHQALDPSQRVYFASLTPTAEDIPLGTFRFVAAHAAKGGVHPRVHLIAVPKDAGFKFLYNKITINGIDSPPDIPRAFLNPPKDVHAVCDANCFTTELATSLLLFMDTTPLLKPIAVPQPTSTIRRVSNVFRRLT